VTSRRARVAVTFAVVVVGGIAVALGTSAGAARAPTCLGKRATIVGTGGADILTGTPRNDVIAGLGGADRIDGRGGSDLVCAGAGADVLAGGTGRDTLDGGPGFDVCRGGERLVRCEEERPAPPAGLVRPGEYFADRLDPAFSFRLDEPGWIGVPKYAPLALVRNKDPGAHGIAFYPRPEPAAALTARLASLEGTQVTGPAPAIVGGVPAQRIDVVVTSGDFVVVPLGGDNALEPTDAARFYVVSSAGKTLAVEIETPQSDFARFVPQAEAVLATVRFAPR